MKKGRIKWNELRVFGLPTFNIPLHPYGPLPCDEPLFFEGQTSLSDWLSQKPYIDTYDYCDGGSNYSCRIFLTNGKDWIEVLPREEDHRYAARHEPDTHTDGVSVGEWLAEHPDFRPIAILTRSRAYCSWEGEDEGPDWSLYLLRPLPDEQVRRVRRRIEDWLRKEASPEVIMGLASTFGLKLD